MVCICYYIQNYLVQLLSQQVTPLHVHLYDDTMKSNVQIIVTIL